MREGFRLAVAFLHSLLIHSLLGCQCNGLWQSSVQSIAGRLLIVCNMKAVLVFISQLSQQKSYGCWCLQSSLRVSETAVHYLNGLDQITVIFINSSHQCSMLFLGPTTVLILLLLFFHGICGCKEDMD